MKTPKNQRVEITGESVSPTEEVVLPLGFWGILTEKKHLQFK